MDFEKAKKIIRIMQISIVVMVLIVVAVALVVYFT